MFFKEKRINGTAVGRTEERAVSGKSERGVTEQISDAETMLPFPLDGFGCDTAAKSSTATSSGTSSNVLTPSGSPAAESVTAVITPVLKKSSPFVLRVVRGNDPFRIGAIMTRVGTEKIGAPST